MKTFRYGKSSHQRKINIKVIDLETSSTVPCRKESHEFNYELQEANTLLIGASNAKMHWGINHHESR